MSRSPQPPIGTPRAADGERGRTARLLGHAWAYELLQFAVGSHRSHALFVAEYVRARADDRILDLGCGPGHIVRALPTYVDYVGVDSNEAYIESARARWGIRGTFRVADAREPLVFDKPFDIVLAMGVLHHLDDAGCSRLLDNAMSVLAPGGTVRRHRPRALRAAEQGGPLAHSARSRKPCEERRRLRGAGARLVRCSRGRSPDGSAPCSVYPRDSELLTAHAPMTPRRGSAVPSRS